MVTGYQRPIGFTNDQAKTPNGKYLALVFTENTQIGAGSGTMSKNIILSVQVFKRHILKRAQSTSDVHVTHYNKIKHHLV
ncbi:MAG: hypothetical protein MJE68_01035, partial [Proteobacteria bacterium]|nr:hypothetical protein [Pseudomonadota bacterium]